MTDFPPEPEPSWTGMRDCIEAALIDVPWHQQRFDISRDSDRVTLAGTLRKAFAPQLATSKDLTETLDRIRALIRRHRHDETIPKRELEAALYGDDTRG